jgi:hypothetical protein
LYNQETWEFDDDNLDKKKNTVSVNSKCVLTAKLEAVRFEYLLMGPGPIITCERINIKNSITMWSVRKNIPGDVLEVQTKLLWHSEMHRFTPDSYSGGSALQRDFEDLSIPGRSRKGSAVKARMEDRYLHSKGTDTNPKVHVML